MKKWWLQRQYQDPRYRLLDRAPAPCPRCGHRLPIDHELVGITYCLCPICGKVFNR